MSADRVKRLKDLMDLLARLPASPQRDRVLSEVRSRAVDLDTGVMPRAMLPVQEPPPPPSPIPPKPPMRDRASSITGTVPPLSAHALELAHSPFAFGHSKDLEQTVCLDERLSLEDSPLPHLRAAQGDRGVRPWTLGLRA